MVVMPVMVINHLVPAPESIPEVTALIAWAIRVAEVVMPIRIRWSVGIDVVTCCFNAVVEPAVPGAGPVTLRFVRMPATFLGMNGERCAARQSQAQNKGHC
jgi:hypothetical protein